VKDSPKHEARSIRCAGMDLGMVRDRTALVIVEHDRYFDRTKLILDRQWAPGKEPLRPNQTIKEMFDIAIDQECSIACADVHYFALIQELIPKEIQLVRFPSNQDRIAKAYQDLKYAFSRSEIDLSLASDRLIKQLANTSATPTQGGGLAISHVRKSGEHGDSAAAFVAAFYGAIRSGRGVGVGEAFGARRFDSKGRGW
jgi:hypothetical protein